MVVENKQGILYLVATPIGNLDDFTYRAVETLKQVNFIYCENPTVSRVLMQKYGINQKLLKFSAVNEESYIDQIIALVSSGNSVAIISDAGTPIISDPGIALVHVAHEKGLIIRCLPGASAVITAACGLGINKFIFEGFLTNKDLKRRHFFESIDDDYTHIFYESPHRVENFIEDIVAVFGVDKKIGIAREITKYFEEIFWIKAGDYLQKLQTNPPRGEFVIAIPATSSSKNTEGAILEQLLDSLKNASTKEIVKILKSKFKLQTSEIYSLVEKFRKS